MADDSKLSSVGGNGFIWILLVVAGTYFASHTIPLSGSRPASTERSIPERVGEQHVDARLWQDPFAAVADVLAKSPELKPENCYRRDSGYKEIETYCRPPWEGSSGLPDLVLVASVSGTPYAEDQEARRRRRYAVLAGLDAEGFVPADAQHIGFYWPEPQPPPQESLIVRLVANSADSRRVKMATSVDSPRVEVSASLAATGAELPKVVPYEWFTPRPERPVRPDDKARYQRILLLWFDEDILAAPAKPGPPEAASTGSAQDAAARPLSRSPTPLQQYAKLLCPYLLASQKERLGKVNILGPQLSTTLKAMVDEVDRSETSPTDWSSGACPRSDPPSFYVSQATVSDATLLPERSVDPSCPVSITCLSKLFTDKKGIKLYRLTATDDALARAIGEELTRRGINRSGPISRWYARFTARMQRAIGQPLDLNPVRGQEGHSHIVLISEWDTLYGRALPDAMARCLGRSPCETVGSDPFSNKEWLHPFKYVRGLDGQMPDGGGLGPGTAAKDGSGKSDKDGKDSAKPWSNPSVKARAEGQSQFDYLQRLGDRIKHLDTELRIAGQHGIAAVGVLGSDLYDKLLVLQALRPLLPDAWFFTTDLDALLLHPTAQSATRNLLVASGFGLQLRPDIQGAIPPFRSNYQTSEFLAARIASQKNGTPNPCWSSSPLLFEIGSSREFQFAETASPDSQACQDALRDCDRDRASSQTPGACTAALREGQRADHEACKKDITNCGLIHPIATAMLPQLAWHSWGALVAVGLLSGFALMFIPVIVRASGQRAHAIDTRPSTGERDRPPFTLSTWALVALGLFIILGIAFALAAPVGDWLTQGGQPMLLLEGISLWPTIFLRGATLLLCIWLLLYSLDHLDANMRQIEHDLHLDEARGALKAKWPGLLADGPLWMRGLRFFGYLLPDTAGNDMLTFWCKYFYRGRPAARFWRVAAGVTVVLLFWGVLFLLFGNPHAPARGGASAFFYHSITFVLFVLTLALIFFVADATWLCWRLTRDIRTPTVLWPRRTLQEFSHRYHLSEGALADCIDLIFVARRSKCITTLLYGPFLVIALIVVSHSQLLAQYGRSIPALITMGAAVLIVIACAVALRVSAEATRAEARRRLNERLVRAKGRSDGAQLAGQLELVLLRIEELREGAFSPFSQQPVVRAMLLPLGGLGGTALLNYLLVPGFG